MKFYGAVEFSGVKFYDEGEFCDAEFKVASKI